MEVLGLTGGIGCGKSTVAQAFARRGVAVVDADRVAREVVMPGTAGLAEIVAAFGPGVLAAEGTLDRAKLAADVFGSDELRRKLNGILHPRIATASASHIAALADRYRWVLYDAALLVENDAWRAMAGLIVVTARTAVQRQRIVARDGVTLQEADARIAAQWPLARKLRIARWIVDNTGSRERLEARVAELYAEIVVKYGSPWIGPSRPSHSGG